MNQSDDLFNVRNNFYVGAYPSAIKDALSTVTESPETTLEKDCLVHRCYIAMGNYKMVMDNISDKDSVDAQSVKLLAVYLNSPEGSRESVLENLKKLLESKSAKTNILAVIGATIYMHEGKYEDALRLLHPRATLEYMSLNVQAFLALFRTDLAQKEVAAMIGINEDATLTQLSIARLNMVLGGAKCQEAYFIYQEMVEKYGGTVMLYNGLAGCQMLQNNYGEAQILLKQALEKNPNDPVTLANLICCDQHVTKGNEFGVYMKQLKASGGSSSIYHQIQSLEASFDSNSNRYSANA